MLAGLLPSSSTRWLVASNTLSQLIGKVIAAGSVFLISLLLARSLGAEGFGDFTKITTFVAFFYLVADFGLNAVYLQKEKSGKTDWWPSLFGLRLLWATLLVFLAIAILAFLPQGQNQGYTNLVRLGIIVFSPAIIFQAILITANGLFQKKFRYDLSALAVFCGSVVSLLLVWLVMHFSNGGFGVIFSVVAILSGMAVTAGVALALVRLIRGNLSISFKFSSMLQLLVASLPLAATLLFNLVYFRADSFILTLTRATAEVGIYGLAYKVFEVPLVLPTFLMNVIYPLLLRVKGQEFIRLWRKSFLILVAAAVLSVIVMWLFAPALALVREDFRASIVPLRILTLGLPFFFISALTMWSLIAMGKQAVLVWIYGFSMLANIFFNILFIPRYGYLAAAWITVGSEAVVLIVSVLVLIRQINK